MWMHAWKCVLSPKHKLHKYMSLNASIQASSISCIIAFLKYVRLRFIMQCKDVMQRKQHAFRAVPINASWSSQHHGLSSKNSICSDLLRALDKVWCGVAWPARPLRSRETAWGQREGPSSLCWTLGLQSDRQSDHGSHFLIYNDSGLQQRVWMRWFYSEVAEHTDNLIPYYTLHKIIILTKKNDCPLQWEMFKKENILKTMHAILQENTIFLWITLKFPLKNQ